MLFEPKAFLDGISSIFMLGIPPKNNFIEIENDQDRLKLDVVSLRTDFSKACGTIEDEFIQKT